MRQWTPAQEGRNFEFSPILKPLERYRDQLTVLTNLAKLRRERALGEHGDVDERHVSLEGQPAEALDHGRSDHRAAHRSRHDVPVDGVRHRSSLEPSRQLRRRLPVLLHEHDQLGVTPRSRCRWRSTRAWSSSGCSAATAATPEERKARLQKNTSILDAVVDERETS
jgi:hypothetical protein